MKKFNDWLGLHLTNMVGTMWCAYVFAALAVVGYPFGSSDPRLIVQWFAQTFLQLVLLSVIIVGQNLQSQKHDDLHQDVKAIHAHLGIKKEDK